MAFGLKKTKFEVGRGRGGLEKARKTTGTEQLADEGQRWWAGWAGVGD